MKRAVKQLACMALLVFLFPSMAFAHVLKADGDIGAIIHIDPEDDPYVGQPANFYFEFKDRTGKFDIATCDCSISISNRGTVVKTEALLSPTYQFTFPEKSLYSIQVSGKPKPGSNFQAFRLSYDFRVDRGDATQTTASSKDTSHTAHYIIFGAGLLAVIIGYLVQRKKEVTLKHKTKAVTMKGLLAFVALSGLLFHHTGVLADACHEQGVAQHSQQYACCSVPSMVLSETVIASAEQVSYHVAQRSEAQSFETISESTQNKSPPVG